MYNSIQKIWYDKLRVEEDYITERGKIMELHRENEEREHKLHSIISAEAQSELEKITENYFELIGLLQADAFVKGFKLGGGITIEILK